MNATRVALVIVITAAAAAATPQSTTAAPPAQARPDVLCRGDGAAPGTARPAAAPARARATIGQVAWIAGVWIAAGPSSTVEERWTPPAGGSMLAVGRTLRGDRLAAFEFVCISERDGGLVYTAMPNGRTPPTDFVLTAITADSATFENPAHDFPKMVRYSRRADGALETTVAGEGGQRPQTVVLKRETP